MVLAMWTERKGKQAGGTSKKLNGKGKLLDEAKWTIKNTRLNNNKNQNKTTRGRRERERKHLLETWKKKKDSIGPTKALPIEDGRKKAVGEGRGPKGATKRWG